MYSSTRFAELMKGLPRSAFDRIVQKHETDKHSKGFTSHDHLLAMVFAQVSDSSSLREIEARFNSSSLHHYHLGTGAIKRSTLSDANNNRDSCIFEEVCSVLMTKVSRKFRNEIRERLLIIDSTPIRLVGNGYDEWTSAKRNRQLQGLKTHVMIWSESGMPEFVQTSAANVNDLDVGKALTIEPGATYTMDKGYCDYNWWNHIDETGAYFVTRLKVNAAVVEVEERDCGTAEGILSDTLITFKTKFPGAKRRNDYYGKTLRRVVVDRPTKSRPLELVTNDLERSAEEVASVYKRRWEIENFFKWLKQNLKIKRFLGRSENAVKIQIYTAIIAQLLVELYRRIHSPNSTAKMTLATLRTWLFQRPKTDYERLKQYRQTLIEFRKRQGQLAF